MLDVDFIFRGKSPDFNKLLKYGFTREKSGYVYSAPILRNQFNIRVCVSQMGEVRVKVFESESGEEYVLVHISNSQGGFVGRVCAACEIALLDILKKCFIAGAFKARQTQDLIDFIHKKFGVSPEFPWDDSPDCAIFRIKKGVKWFAIIMTVPKNKIGFDSDELVEVINLKNVPENIEKLVDGEKFFKAYHMNKKHWYTVCLDARVPQEDLQHLVETSYNLVCGKTKSQAKVHVKVREKV